VGTRPSTERALIAACVDSGNAAVLRAQALLQLQHTLGCDEGFFIPFSHEFFALAPPYLRAFASTRVYEAGAGPPMARAWRSGCYVDTSLYSMGERDRLPLYSELLRPYGLREQLVALVRFGGRTSAVIHLNRVGRGNAFRRTVLDHLRGMLPLIGMLHAAVSPIADAESARHLGSRLSPRQLEIALLVGEGCQNAQVAARLSLSERTVRNQVSEIFARLGVFSRAELAILCERTGLLAASSTVQHQRLPRVLHQLARMVGAGPGAPD
jgi:DNA-binding CsgD family transcriptional regulator